VGGIQVGLGSLVDLGGILLFAKTAPDKEAALQNCSPLRKRLAETGSARRPRMSEGRGLRQIEIPIAFILNIDR
jgi:hypothetical protein